MWNVSPGSHRVSDHESEISEEVSMNIMGDREELTSPIE